jgi:hypothetical protein
MGGGVFGGEVVENVNEKIPSDLVKREEETKRRSGSAIFCSTIFLLHPMPLYFTHFSFFFFSFFQCYCSAY